MVRPDYEGTATKKSGTKDSKEESDAEAEPSKGGDECEEEEEEE